MIDNQIMHNNNYTQLEGIIIIITTCFSSVYVLVIAMVTLV